MSAEYDMRKAMLSYDFLLPHHFRYHKTELEQLTDVMTFHDVLKGHSKTRGSYMSAYTIIGFIKRIGGKR